MVLDIKQVGELHCQVNLREILKRHLYFVFNDLQRAWGESEKANIKTSEIPLTGSY